MLASCPPMFPILILTRYCLSKLPVCFISRCQNPILSFDIMIAGHHVILSGGIDHRDSYASPTVLPPETFFLTTSFPSPGIMPHEELCLTRSYASPGVMPHQKLCLIMSYASPGVIPHHELCLTMSYASPGVMPYQEL